MTTERGRAGGAARWWRRGRTGSALARWRRGRSWVTATRRRRWTARLLAVLALAVVLPAALGGAALAGSGSPSTPGSVNSALSWMAVRDSAGVPLSQYMFVTDRGGVLNPGNTVLSTIISLEFAGWVVIVTTAIWIIGYALSFQWLASIGSALEGVAANLSGQLATPIMLITAAAIGAFFVAYFIVRGQSAKAVAQVCTMVLVALAGPFFLAHPLEDALAADGVLAKGRDVGITVAAGLNGSTEVNPLRLVATIQTTLADNLARRPLQVWNFGHVLDDRPACGGVWTAGMLSGDEDRVKDGLQSCGDNAAFVSASNPGAGQIGAGLLMLVTSLIVCGLGVMLAWRILRAGMRTLKHGIYSIFGFAAGGFVYGPTQSFLVYNIVDGLIAAAMMVVDTIALGAVCLFYGNLFQQAGGQVMAVLVISAGAGLVVIVEMRALNKRIMGGSEWMVDRIGTAMRGEGGRGGGGGGGGMGVGAGQAMGGLGLLNTLAAISTVNSSPATEWLWGGVRNPLRPRAFAEKAMQKSMWEYYAAPGLGGATGWMVQAQLNREQFAVAARAGAQHGGGIDTPRGAAAAIRRLRNSGGLLDGAYGALTGAGFSDREIMARAVRSWGMMEDNAEDETLTNRHLGHVVAAMQNAGHSGDRLLAGNGDPDEMVAHLATLEAVAARWRNAHAGGVTLDGGAVSGVQRRYVEDYMRNPTMEKLTNLQKVADGDRKKVPLSLSSVDRNAAGRMMKWIGNEHARLTTEAVDSVLANVSDPQRMRDARAVITAATDTDLWSSGVKRGTWHTLTPPGTHRPDVAAWQRAMGPVEERLR
ncbi:hypothetical protein [Nocardia asteroides]|uniref:hypothetical protein n=1 Tax=Nocardia asteroides TaxID=1824 RepID=UPI001E61C5E8|nr:hypothetical protein [Nocardia asteroides]UGT63364.1 hypothetical protein LTT61_08655 [Nocardia asteroides]